MWNNLPPQLHWVSNPEAIFLLKACGDFAACGIRIHDFLVLVMLITHPIKPE